MKKIQPFIVGPILGVLLIYGVLYKLNGLKDYAYYKFLFQHLPETMIQIQYCLSISLRCVGLVTGIGLICRREFYRRTAIVLASVNLLTLYWKHPYEVFYHIAVFTEKGFPLPYPIIPKGEVLVHPMFPWISLGIFSLIDVIFSVAIIYFLTRPDVKAQFSQEHNRKIK